MACGHDMWAWHVGMACGHDMWAWHVGMAGGGVSDPIIFNLGPTSSSGTSFTPRPPTTGESASSMHGVELHYTTFTQLAGGSK
jgi:hypothetical protein